jgi:hypothetical protein
MAKGAVPGCGGSYKEDGAVRALPEAARIAVLAIATGAREASLRRMPELCDIPASKTGSLRRL